MSTHSTHSCICILSERACWGRVGGVGEMSTIAGQGNLLTVTRGLDRKSSLPAVNWPPEQDSCYKRWTRDGQGWWTRVGVPSLLFWVCGCDQGKVLYVNAQRSRHTEEAWDEDEEAAKYEGLWLGRQSSTFPPA